MGATTGALVIMCLFSGILGLKICYNTNSNIFAPIFVALCIGEIIACVLIAQIVRTCKNPLPQLPEKEELQIIG